MPIDYKDSSQRLSQRDAFRRSRLARWYRAIFERTIRGLIRGSRRVLDLGAGEGILLENLRREGAGGLLIAGDLDAENAEICRDLGFPSVRTDACELGFKSGAFDCVVLMSMLEHVEAPRKTLEEVYRVLEPGGRSIILVPNDRVFDRARRLLGRPCDAHEDLGHVVDWTPDSLSEAVRAAGFRMEMARNMPFPWWTLSLHHLVVGRKP